MKPPVSSNKRANSASIGGDSPTSGAWKSRWFGLAAVLVLTGLIYLPGIYGPVLLDDAANITDNPRVHTANWSIASLPAALDAAPNGNGSRALSYLSFALNYQFASDPIRAIKLTNILLHLLAGILIYSLSCRLLVFWLDTRRVTGVALAAAALWMLNPLNVSTVLYAVQRMSQLSAIFTLAGCVYYLRWRARQQREGPAHLEGMVWLASLGVAAYLCKENGALLPAYLLVIELTTLRFAFARDKAWMANWLRAYLGLPVLLLAAVLLWLLFFPLQDVEAMRGFTVMQRLLTETRVLWMYLGWNLYLPYPAQAFFYDNYQLSTSLIAPWSTLGAVLAWLAVILLITRLWRRNTLIPGVFAIAWFLIGQSMESTSIPLELVFEHRNYMPSLGPILGLAAAGTALLHYGIRSELIRATLFLAFLVVVPAALLASRVADWADANRMAKSLVSNNPSSARSWAQLGITRYSSGDTAQALGAWRHAESLDASEAAYPLMAASVRCLNHLPMPADLVKRIQSALFIPPTSPFTQSQWLALMLRCERQPAYDAALLPLFSQAVGHPNRKIAGMARVALEMIRRRQQPSGSVH